MATVATDEYRLITEHAGLLDSSGRGKLLLTGTDAAEFLQGQLTNDIEALTPGEGCYAALLNHKGKLRADARVLRGDGWILLDTELAGLAPLTKTIRMYSLGRDVKLEDQSDQRAVLSLLGPGADTFLESAPPDEEHSFIEGEHGLYVRTDLGIDVVCSARDAGSVGATIGAEEVSESAAECARIESGRPRFGLDMDGETMPQEADINDRAVSFTKGCYVGQETVARLHYRGKPNRGLRGLELSAPASHGDPVTAGDRVMGRLGSACTSPARGPIALAILRREVGPSDSVSVGHGLTATVVDLPFVPRR